MFSFLPLEESDAEIVSIATPHGFHAEMSINCMRAGKHVLVEKPMALNSIDCNRMIDASQLYKRKLIVIKQNRYNIPIKLVKTAIDEKRLGRIFYWTGALIGAMTVYAALQDYSQGNPISPDFLIPIFFVLCCMATGYVLAGGWKDGT